MSRYSEHQDSYRQALTTLTHVPMRFLPGAITEVAERYGRAYEEVEADMLDHAASPVEANEKTVR